MDKNVSQKRKESRTLEVQASDIKGILREQRKSTKILSDIKDLLKEDTKEPLVSQKTVTEKKEELKQTAALLQPPIKKEPYDDEEEKKSTEVDADIPDKPQKKTSQKPTGAARGVGMLGAVGAVAGVGAVLGGLVGLGFDKRSQLPETEQEAAERGVSLSKENQIFSEKPKGLAQVLDEQEAERKKKQKEAAEIGPSRVTREDYQAAQNQAADIKAAKETRERAGVGKPTFQYVPRLGRITAGQGEGDILDYPGGERRKIDEPTTEAVQAQAAREAVERGLRQRRRGKDSEQSKVESASTAVPAPPKANSSEISTQKSEPQMGSQVESKAGPNWKAKINDYTPEFNPVAYLEQKHPGISKIYIDLSKKLAPRSDSQMSIKQHEEMLKLMALERVKGKDGESSVEAKQQAYQPTQMKDEQVESKDSVVSKATPSRNPEDEMARLQAVGAQKGLSGRISGSYEGGQLVRVKDESGKEVDVSDQLTPEQKSKVEFARQMRADNARSADLQNQVTQSSAENRELTREVPSGQVQPIVVNNNNNMSSQSYVPVQAQPRLPSSFSRFQERTASY